HLGEPGPVRGQLKRASSGPSPGPARRFSNCPLAAPAPIGYPQYRHSPLPVIPAPPEGTMNKRTGGVGALVCGLVVAARLGAGLLMMGGAMIQEAAQPQPDGQRGLAPAPFIENLVFDGGFGEQRAQPCTREELKAARGPVTP